VGALRRKIVGVGVMGKGPENWHSSDTAAPAGEAWAALGRPNL